MNLNEECLLQFLTNDAVGGIHIATETAALEGTLTGELRRILRRNRYVSFPSAILIRRPSVD